MYCSLCLGFCCFFFPPLLNSHKLSPLGFPFKVSYLLWLDLKSQMLRRKESYRNIFTL